MAPTGKRTGDSTRVAGSAFPNSAGYLDGRLLIAMPVMGDSRFERSVIYLCAHSAEGAMGIIVNHPAGSIDFPELLVQLGIINEPAAIKAQHAGICVVMDRCVLIEHARLFGNSARVA